MFISSTCITHGIHLFLANFEWVTREQQIAPLDLHQDTDTTILYHELLLFSTECCCCYTCKLLPWNFSLIIYAINLHVWTSYCILSYFIKPQSRDFKPSPLLFTLGILASTRCFLRFYFITSWDVLYGRAMVYYVITCSWVRNELGVPVFLA